ncbi:class I SAM-dependent methyltransferase [Paenibacillus sp. RRE4]|uniref:class I SAM-dependent methyltransferase n=1 Tax=Paenibacillus sp. RRE4 TaxID=2962587 RepID=UPI0028820AC0|nr:class I SAM-dependent methyltransferase [Paenibacillus sp. RRE4]MDT0122763.1 class I SAM-dependent methyltransferase [Paenibacillus sp. RRE4]
MQPEEKQSFPTNSSLGKNSSTFLINETTPAIQDLQTKLPIQSMPILTMLQPSPGERILDLGCGNGMLTAKIAATGAITTGIDFSKESIAQALEKYPELDFKTADAAYYRTKEPYDAVFSHAAFHWMADAPAALRTVQLALKQGGRFVTEFAGSGNTAILLHAVQEELLTRGYTWEGRNPWYHPTVGEFSSLLEQYGFRVLFIQHADTMRPLKQGVRQWLSSFASYLFHDIDAEEQEIMMEVVEKKVEPQLYREGQWNLDIARMRVVAVKG